ncbi:MAG: energy transducer TonB [Cytophagaceae bacterium]|nr:energy transducer TonB [Cytophagaceae bacterium]
MQVKKNKTADLNTYKTLFFQIGLIMALLVTYFTLETKTYKSEINNNALEINVDYILEDNIPITRVEITPPPPPKIESTQFLEVIENDTEVEESIIESTETSLDEAIVAENTVLVDEVSFAKEEVIEDVPFVLVEEVPVYPGCESQNDKTARKDCMSKKITEFVTKEFDNSLGRELGLTGVQKIYVLFTIDENGNIVDVHSRAPHPALEQEASRVVSMLPNMTPGKQRGRPVRVAYSMPIIFEIRSI